MNTYFLFGLIVILTIIIIILIFIIRYLNETTVIGISNNALKIKEINSKINCIFKDYIIHKLKDSGPKPGDKVEVIETFIIGGIVSVSNKIGICKGECYRSKNLKPDFEFEQCNISSNFRIKDNREYFIEFKENKDFNEIQIVPIYKLNIIKDENKKN